MRRDTRFHKAYFADIHSFVFLKVFVTVSQFLYER